MLKVMVDILAGAYSDAIQHITDYGGMSQERLCKNQVLLEFVKGMFFFCFFFCVDLTWNDPIMLLHELPLT